MSAFAGIMSFDGAAAAPLEATARRMIATMPHRGVDAVGVWAADGAALAFRSLATTVEARSETVPVHDPPSGIVAVADVRIDNRDALIRELDPPGGRAIGDVGLIVAAYLRWGDGCAEHLLGDFAYVLWDPRRGHAVCARDPLGVKLFYYYHRPGRCFAFASEIKALLAHPDVPRRLNEVRIAEYIDAVLDDRASTFYTDIARLPAAQTAVVTADRVVRRTYWALDPEREVRCRSNGEYAERFRALLVDAVRCRVRGDGPVGAQLSGGLDSSAVAGAARSVLGVVGRPLHVFSAVFEGLACDERDFIAAFVGQGGVTAHACEGDELRPFTDIERTLDAHDEPFFVPNLALGGALCHAASRLGVRVMLDGLDGDSTVSHGVGYLAELAVGGHWLRLHREARALAAGDRRAARRIIVRQALLPAAPPSLRAAARQWRAARTGVPGPTDAPSVLRADFVRHIGWADRRRHLEAGDGGPIRSERTAHYRRLTRAIIPFALEATGREAGRYGVEPRHPFFDQRLVEFCLALPGDQKLEGGWTRVVMRRAIEGLVPPVIQWRRTKSNLSPVLLRDLRSRAELLDRVLADAGNPLGAYVDLARMRAMRSALADPRDMDRVAMTLWKAASLGLWLERSGVARS